VSFLIIVVANGSVYCCSVDDEKLITCLEMWLAVFFYKKMIFLIKFFFCFLIVGVKNKKYYLNKKYIKKHQRR